MDKETESRPLFHTATGSVPLMSPPHKKKRPNAAACPSTRHVHHDNNRLWMTISDRWLCPVLFFLYFVFRYNTGCVI
ncbi:hypothetical protein [Phocaeicola vulgatus]|uniref:hypothetical protein n=1 Tax=Phocaeicola vulgatus TaxID=821 RepID=UPI0035626D17